ncbi:energy transducer TonB [Sphingomonas sp. CL5.1]|uniref:energy transducer TonB n=1 Tax=Sphingomonas sp. CL5.1 TaxID=2653203 RepID=UPI0015827FF8|nr:energy transducer TonB [Sphingomonas sp. CL5.1]QKS01649.1 energy transducer TonB [Sphingomonas sp. CL5.1]
MAYADQKMSGSKVVAIIIVAAIHLALGYAFVTGLAYQYVKKVSEKLNTFDVEEPPPPPPDEPPPPPPDVPMTPPPVVTPPPIVSAPTVAPPIISVPVPPPPRPVEAPPPPPPPPAPPRISQAAVAKGNPGQYFNSDNYPPSALRAGEQGRVVASLTIGTDGRVADCEVTSSSGSAALDQATCRIAKSRVRYTPAKDENGQPIASRATLPVKWVIPE